MLKTKDFIQKFNQTEEVPEDSLLVTLRCKIIYVNIPNRKRIKTVKEAYDKHPPNKTLLTKVITAFFSLILTLNSFIFNSVIYIIKMGCAMGALCAPSCANLLMVQFKEKHIYQYIKDMAVLHLRYVDDIFIIWNSTKDQLIAFIDKLNKKHKTIKFEYKISLQKISFSDTMVYIYKDGIE